METTETKKTLEEKLFCRLLNGKDPLDWLEMGKKYYPKDTPLQLLFEPYGGTPRILAYIDKGLSYFSMEKARQWFTNGVGCDALLTHPTPLARLFVGVFQAYPAFTLSGDEVTTVCQTLEKMTPEEIEVFQLMLSFLSGAAPRSSDHKAVFLTFLNAPKKNIKTLAGILQAATISPVS
jgi:hypothetical protein